MKVHLLSVSLPTAGSFMKLTTSTEWLSCWKSWAGEKHSDGVSGPVHFGGQSEFSIISIKSDPASIVKASKSVVYLQEKNAKEAVVVSSFLCKV